MSQFAVPVREYMTSDVVGLSADASLSEADAKLAEVGVSALPVLDASSRLAGVISRTDLLRAGRVRLDEGKRERVLSLPDAKVREFMTSTVAVASPDTPLWEAAKRMARERYHRLFVAEDSRPLGVISTKEMMRALADARAPAPLSSIMTKGVVSVSISDPLTLAVDRMAASHSAGLVVQSDGWPVGIFSQVEALGARDGDPQSPVERWMDMGLLSLPAGMPAHLAAAQGLATDTRRIVAVEGSLIAGLVTGMDFTRLVGESHNT